MNTRDSILFTTLKLAVERGINKASMSEIAAEVGISKAAIYHHFPSKEKLLEAVVEMTYFRYLETVHNLLADSNISPLARLQNAFKFASDDFVEWNQELTGNEIGRLSFELITFETILQYPRLEQRRYEYSQKIRNAARAAIKQGIETGEINSEIDCEEGAIAYIVMLEGTYFICSDHQDLDIAKTYASMLNMFLRIVNP